MRVYRGLKIPNPETPKPYTPLKGYRVLGRYSGCGPNLEKVCVTRTRELANISELFK